MLRKILCTVAVLGVSAGLALADQIDWQNTSPIYTKGGVPMPDMSPDLIQMFYPGVDGVISPEVGGDDVAIAGATGAFNIGAAGYFYTQLNPVALGIADGASVFTRIYDTASRGTAANYLNVGGLQTVGDSTPPATAWQYDVGGSNPSGNDWQTIPEPSSMLLFGIGAITLAIRKRMGK